MRKASLPKEKKAEKAESSNTTAKGVQENATVGIQEKAINIGGTVNQSQQQVTKSENVVAGQINGSQGQYVQVSGFVGGQVNGVSQQAGQFGSTINGQINASQGQYGQAGSFVGGQVNGVSQQAGQLGNTIKGQINGSQGQYGQAGSFVGGQVNGVSQQAGQFGNTINGQINGSQGQYGQVGGFVGGQANGTNQQAGQFGNNISGKINGSQQIKENAGSIAGALETPGKFGYVGGFFGQQTQQSSEYAGGYIEQPQEKVLRIGYDTTLDDEKNTNLPVKQVGFLQKLKEMFLPSEWVVPELKIGLTDKEVKVLTEVHDFLFQDISFKGFMNIFKKEKNK